MKNYLQYLTVSLALVASLSAAGADAIPEKASSLMASGRWVKIRVDSDGVYQLTDARLKELGFSDPSKVNVFGYSPVMLIDHDLSVAPVDIEPLQSIYTSGKLLFYGKSNTDFAYELWEVRNRNEFGVKGRRRYEQTQGATYFLSDCSVSRPAISTIDAPAQASSTAFASHSALAYYEIDQTNLSGGGAWHTGPAINSVVKSDNFQLTLGKVAEGGKARAVYLSLLAPSAFSDYNVLTVTYPEGFTSAEYKTNDADQGFHAYSLSGYAHYNPSMRYQEVTVPEVNDYVTYNFSASVHPNAAKQNGDCALDYFALLYDRKNDMSGEAQMHMYYSSAGTFQLQNADGAVVWDVSDPLAIKSYTMSATGEGALRSPVGKRPTEVVSFFPAQSQPEPVVIGDIANQNLHSASTPDMVIITSGVLMDAAEIAADVHRRKQGFDVMVVDQQQIFNEYSSGNVSPEAVRRFLRHLSLKSPGKLKGAMMLGPATINTAKGISDDSPNVISYEIDDMTYTASSTSNFVNDTFFGIFGTTLPDNSQWNGRRPSIRRFGMGLDLPVTRLPISSIQEIRDYYAKVEEYLSGAPAIPAWGNVIVASDYADANIASHFYDGEYAINAIPRHDELITVTRAAKNYAPLANRDVVTRDIQDLSLTDRAQLYYFFGHGSYTSIGGGGKVQLMDVNHIQKLNTPCRFPLAYLGTCNVAAYDKYPNNLAKAMIATPTGGFIGVIAAGREMYQIGNRKLGARVAANLYLDTPHTYMGDMWVTAFNEAVGDESSSTTDVLNYLAYNYIGDPLIPVYAPTHTMTLNEFTQLNLNGTNTITGTVSSADFNGMAVATVYDVPETKNNYAITSSTTDISYTQTPSFDDGAQIIGRYYGNVVNGKLKIDFVGPVTSRDGNHRIQVYAYSSDGQSRAIDVITNVPHVFDSSSQPPVEDRPVTIADFGLENIGDGDRVVCPVNLTAEINAPAGLATISAMTTPVKLTIDGTPVPNAGRMISFTGNDNYVLRVNIHQLAFGRHECTLTVRDANGKFADRTMVFFVDNAPAASLVANESDNGDVILDFTTPFETAESVLFIENIEGTLVKKINNPAFPLDFKSLDLGRGLYRAYVSLRNATALSSSNKVDIMLD